MPISSIVVKTDTAAVKKFSVDDPAAQESEVQQKNTKKLECVFLKVGEKAKIRIIKTGIQDDTNIEVTDGLKPGDVVIVGPYNTVSKELNSGDKVKIAAANDKKVDKE